MYIRGTKRAIDRISKERPGQHSKAGGTPAKVEPTLAWLRRCFQARSQPDQSRLAYHAAGSQPSERASERASKPLPAFQPTSRPHSAITLFHSPSTFFVAALSLLSLCYPLSHSRVPRRFALGKNEFSKDAPGSSSDGGGGIDRSRALSQRSIGGTHGSASWTLGSVLTRGEAKKAREVKGNVGLYFCFVRVVS